MSNPTKKLKRIDIRKFWTVLKHQIITSWTLFMMIPIMLVFNMVLGIVTPEIAPAGAIDFTAIFFVLSVGLTVQGALFKYCQYNGTSRRTYFLASLTFLAIVAFFTTLLSTVLSHIMYATGNTGFDLFGLNFRQIIPEGTYYEGVDVGGQVVIGMIMFTYAAGNFGMRFFWTLSISICLAFVTWFIKVIFDVLSRRARFIALGILIGVVIILTLISMFAVDRMWLTLFGFFFGLQFFGNTAAAAAVSGAWSLLFATLFGAGVWLVLRKLPVG